MNDFNVVSQRWLTVVKEVPVIDVYSMVRGNGLGAQPTVQAVSEARWAGWLQLECPYVAKALATVARGAGSRSAAFSPGVQTYALTTMLAKW
jgi:hypothetical protein